MEGWEMGWRESTSVIISVSVSQELFRMMLGRAREGKGREVEMNNGVIMYNMRTLGDTTSYNAQFSQSRDGVVSGVWFRAG